MKINKYVVLGFFVFGAFIGFMMCAYESVEYHYGGIIGEQYNLINASQLCGNKTVLGVHGSCNRIQVYCKKYWNIIHIWTHCGATKDYSYHKWWWEIE